MGIFITGTDTNVGKTLFTSCLTRILSKSGFRVAVYKPVQSGAIKQCNKLVSPDLRFIREFIKDDAILTDKNLFNSYCLKKESSPHLAAELEKKSINISAIKKKYNELIKKYDYVIVEGAGGLVVPILRTYTILELIKDLSIPVIIVARSGLGTINHTSLTIRCLKQSSIKVIGVVLNFYRKGIIEEDNKKIIEELNKVPVLGFIPYYNQNILTIKNKILNDFEKNVDVERIINIKFPSLHL